MLCCKRAQLSIGRGRQLQQVLHQSIHYTTPQLLSDNSDNDDDKPTTSSSTPPVQTLNKSPIVQQLWKTRDEAKRRVMGELTLGDGEYSGMFSFIAIRICIIIYLIVLTSPSNTQMYH